LFHPQGPTFFELARQALSSTERGYDLLAAKFDFTPFRTPDPILRVTAEYLKPQPPERILDLCCGTGAGLELLVPLATKLAVGLDFSGGMLAIARRKTGAPVVRAQALAPPFQNAFDLVTCFSALGHFRRSERRALVAAVRSCLRPGGRFVFATLEGPGVFSRSYWLSRAFNASMHVRNALWSPPFIMFYLSFRLPEARALLEAEGFEVRVKRGVFPAPYDGLCLVDAARPAS
jgi:SAM-dependent methyltransferase